jgi:selenide,water dikinase
MVEVGVHAATDVTGFGLLGHLRNMTLASGVSAEIRFGAIPIVSAATRYVAEGIVPGGTHANHRYLQEHVDFQVGKSEQLLVCDAQTSGGLLIAVPEAKADVLERELARRGATCAVRIGRLTEGSPGRASVLR